MCFLKFMDQNTPAFFLSSPLFFLPLSMADPPRAALGLCPSAPRRRKAPVRPPTPRQMAISLRVDAYTSMGAALGCCWRHAMPALHRRTGLGRSTARAAAQVPSRIPARGARPTR